MLVPSVILFVYVGPVCCFVCLCWSHLLFCLFMLVPSVILFVYVGPVCYLFVYAGSLHVVLFVFVGLSLPPPSTGHHASVLVFPLAD